MSDHSVPSPPEVVDEEKAALLVEETESAAKLERPQRPKGPSRRFLFGAAVNCLSTAGIVFVNKRIFEDAALRGCQITFAAYHFLVTAALLYILSRPAINLFQAKQVAILQILPLSLAMIFNVVLPNASLAYSSIQFYQICRSLLTPCVALLNYWICKATIPTQAMLALIPTCVGVAMVSYFETASKTGDKTTTPIGVMFALAGVLASSVYTVWIARYHKLLECTSMQLLLNQAPVSVLVLAYIIPFSDDVTVWKDTPAPIWLLIGLSGLFACLINLSQFIIIHESGPVSSTVVGHLKTILIVSLGWVYSGKSVRDWTMLGVLVAISGMLGYSYAIQKYARK
ncbi:hypothetical protein AMS68_000858 [Peltaster fructicola]|uniref:Sugar phosphate transporter domain-containing protein n=1 Tax=Peltaster fructicola TaxID=286661 RepID=A0A6H0XL31_9PEZI|nr:hypothetical protein AMS68_000858 [Peltaster fructicola]